MAYVDYFKFVSPASIRAVYEKYERRITPLAFIAGFAWDNLTLTRIDLWYDNLVLVFYLVVAGAAILFLNAHEAAVTSEGARPYGAGKFLIKIPQAHVLLFIPLAMQFAFGGLFSGFFVFYSRSGSLATSWPFFLFLAVLLLGNEFFRKNYSRLIFYASLFFTAVFFYSIFLLPMVLGTMGARIFLLSGAASIAAFSLLLYAIRFLNRVNYNRNFQFILAAAGGIYVFFNVLYFANIIPPIPLALKELGVYHSVRRVTDGYEVRFERRPWYSYLTKYAHHRMPGEPVYAFSAVFAPTRLGATIAHRWSYFDDTSGKWVASDVLRFQIAGGRDGGYRGYTFKANVFPGKWRVEVITERGQILGRTTFWIKNADVPPELDMALR